MHELVQRRQQRAAALEAKVRCHSNDVLVPRRAASNVVRFVIRSLVLILFKRLSTRYASVKNPFFFGLYNVTLYRLPRILLLAAIRSKTLYRFPL